MVRDTDLFSTFDASVWSKRFVQRAGENPEIPKDEGAMLAWFAGAIMAGFDYAKRGGVA